MREQFFNEINNILKSLGFTKHEDSFIKIGHTMPINQTIIVNGQRVKQEQTPKEVTYSIKDIGDGYCENMDGSNRREANWFEFKILVDNKLHSKTSGMYYLDDLEDFKTAIVNIFQL